MGRWKEKLAPRELAALESVIGPFLRELGYSPSAPAKASNSLRAQRLRITYHSMFAGKLWLKQNSPLARYLTRLGRIEVQPASAPARD